MAIARTTGNTRGSGKVVKKTVINGIFVSKLLNTQKKLLVAKLNLQLLRTPVLTELKKIEIVNYFNLEHSRKCLVCKTKPCLTKVSHSRHIFDIEDVNMALVILNRLPEEVVAVNAARLALVEEKRRQKQESQRKAVVTKMRMEADAQAIIVVNSGRLEVANEWIDNVQLYL
jgi:hypothetical protein